MAKPERRDLGKERFWRQTLKRWRSSGLTVRAFCALEGLSEANFYAWRRVLAERAVEESPSVLAVARRSTQRRRGAVDTRGPETGRASSPRFVSLVVLPDAAAAVPTPLALVLASGPTIQVGPGFDAATLAQILDVLEARSC